MKTTTTKSSTIKTDKSRQELDEAVARNAAKREALHDARLQNDDVPVETPKPVAKKTAKKTPAKKTTKPAAKKSRKHQKKTLGRTAISRRARRIRRDFFNRQMELEFAKANRSEFTDAAFALIERRFTNVEAAFLKLPKLVAELEVPKAAAQRALAQEDEDEGEDE